MVLAKALSSGTRTFEEEDIRPASGRLAESGFAGPTSPDAYREAAHNLARGKLPGTVNM